MTLAIDGIRVHRGESRVLDGFSLQVKTGEIAALLGRNGAGKTTTLRAIMGLSPPNEGEIRLDGEPLAGLPPHRIARAGVAFLPESRGVLPGLTVREMLDLASGRRDGPWTPERVRKFFPRLAEREDHRGDQLSGGEQQMLGIASALLLNPRLLLLDEPSHGLAPILAAEVAEQIAALAAEGLTVLLVEQNLRYAQSLAASAHILGKGRLRWSGPMDDLRHETAIVATWLGVATAE